MTVKARASITLVRVNDGSTGQGIDSIVIEFYLSTSKTSLTGGSWSTSQPTWKANTYLWTRNKITYKNPTKVEYTTAQVDTTWEVINDNVAIASTSYEYYISSSSTELKDGEWITDMPEYTKGAYIWYRTKCVLTNGLIEYNEPQLMNVMLKELEDKLADIKGELDSKIESVEDGNIASVEEIKTILNDNIQAIQIAQSQITQNSESVDVSLKKVQDITDAITGMVTRMEINQYMRFEDGILTLGESNSPFSVKLSTTELGFYESGTRVAYISNQQLHISRAVILDKIQIGTFYIEYDKNVGLMIH